MSSKNQSGAGNGVLVGTAVLSGLAAVIIAKNFLDKEKAVQHRISTDYGVGDGAFRRTMSQLLGPPLLDGNKIEALQNGNAIFPAMLTAIASAQHSITFENFVFTEGYIAELFVNALAERAQHGVKVHFLQDALGCDCLHGPLFRTLKRSGVEVEIFRYLHLFQFNHRTHRKLLVVDGRVGFIGGVCISDDWDGDGHTEGHWRDSHYRVEGPAVAQMQQAFMDNWIRTRSAILHGDAYFPELPPVGDTLCQVFRSSSSDGADSARLMFLFSIAAARDSILIANPYFIPDALTIRMLLEARQRNVDIQIIVPCEKIDQRLVRMVGRSCWGPLLEAGVRFFEYQSALLHCKYFIVDHQWVSVGSSNLDDRSLCLNEEANLNVLDQTFAAQQAEVFAADKRDSREITLHDWQHRPWSEKILGHAGSVFRSQM